MANAKDEPANPFLSTPVAAAAVAFYAAHDYSKPEKAIIAAEEFVGALIERGHLPREMAAEDPPPVDDAVLLAQGFFLGLLRWEPYSPGDPRGTLYITAPETPQFGYQLVGKLECGVMRLDDAGRQHLEDLISKRRRGL